MIFAEHVVKVAHPEFFIWIASAGFTFGVTAFALILIHLFWNHRG